MNNYKRGRNFEYQVKYFFEKLGYNVIRSAGSHSKSDIIVNKYNTTYYIQYKNDKQYINVKFIKNIIEQLIKENKVAIINNEIIIFNRNNLLNLLKNKNNKTKLNIDNIINNDNILNVSTKINKIYNKIIDYLNYNDFVILNIPRRKTWLVCLKTKT